MFRRIMRRVILVAFVPALWSAASAAHGAERYYMMIFAAEGEPNIAVRAHTFASFIKIDDGDRTKKPAETHTISWLPASLDIRLIARPEQGANLSLPATLKWEKAEGASVFAWGPFEIRKNLYDRALAQIKRLNSGTVAYKAMDRRFRPDGGSNCFHAVSDIVNGPLLETGTAFGVPATLMVLEHLSPWIIEPGRIHTELVPRFGLGGYRINYRNERPTPPNNVPRKPAPAEKASR